MHGRQVPAWCHGEREQSPAVSHGPGRELLPLYQLGNVWGRLGGNFITLCWAVPLMRLLLHICKGPCIFSGSAGSSWITLPWLSRGKGRGRGNAITSLQKKLQKGFALGGLPIKIWGRCCSVHRVMETAGWSVVYVRLVTRGWWWRTASPVEQTSLGSPLRPFVKSWELFRPTLLFRERPKSQELCEKQHGNTGASLPFVNGKLTIWRQTYC